MCLIETAVRQSIEIGGNRGGVFDTCTFQLLFPLEQSKMRCIYIIISFNWSPEIAG